MVRTVFDIQFTSEPGDLSQNMIGYFFLHSVSDMTLAIR